MSAIARTQKMVFAGEFWRGASGHGLAQGFRKLGWAVQEIDLSRFFAGVGAARLARGVNRLLSPMAAAAFDRALRDAVETLKPDVFLTIKGTRLNRGLLRWIAEKGARTALFYPDFHFDHPGVSLDDFAAYDHIVTTKSFHVEFLRQRFGADKVAYVPHGYSDDVHWPVLGEIAEDEYACDLQHVGAHSAHKEGWLERLYARVPEARLRILGPRWRQGALADVCGDGVLGAAYAITLQSARVNIALMMGPHPSGWEDRVSTRTFEIPACKGFMLHIDNEEVREFFKPGEEIDVFSSHEELAEKSKFYLARPDLRRRMVARAFERCVPAYGYGARARQIAGIVNGESV